MSGAIGDSCEELRKIRGTYIARGGQNSAIMGYARVLFIIFPKLPWYLHTLIRSQKNLMKVRRNANKRTGLPYFNSSITRVLRSSLSPRQVRRVCAAFPLEFFGGIGT